MSRPRLGLAAVAVLIVLGVPALTASIAVPNNSNVTAQERPSGPNDVKPDACSGITLGDGNLLILGGSGHDALSGGSGDDCILGGGGDDTMDGGAGNDVCIGGTGANVAIDCEKIMDASPPPEPLIAPTSASLDGVDATPWTACIPAEAAPAEITAPSEPTPAPCEQASAAPTESPSDPAMAPEAAPTTAPEAAPATGSAAPASSTP